MAETEYERNHSNVHLKPISPDELSVILRSKQNSPPQYVKQRSHSSLSKVPNIIPLQRNARGNFYKFSKPQNSIVARDSLATKSAKDFSFRTRSPITATKPSPFLRSTSSVGVEFKVPSAAQERTSRIPDVPYSNITQSKPLLNYFKNQLTAAAFRNTRRSSHTSQSGSSNLRFRTSSPAKSQGGFKSAQCMKTTSLQFHTHTNNIDGVSVKNFKCGLTAWTMSEEAALQTRSTDDLSVLKETLARSPPHFLINKHSHYRKRAKNTLKYFNSPSFAKYSIEDTTNGESPKSTESSVSDESAVESSTELSEMYSSDDLSKSDHTRGIWSKLSISNSQRTSVDLEWETGQSLQADTFCEQHQEQWQQNGNDEIFSSSNKQHFFNQRFMQPATNTTRLLKRRQQQSFQPKTGMHFAELNRKEMHTFGINLSRQEFRHLDLESKNLLSACNKELDSDQSSGINIMQAHFLRNCESPSKSVATGQHDTSIALQNSHLQRTSSYPDASVHSEHRALRFLMLSQIIQKLLSLHNVYEHQMTRHGIMCRPTSTGFNVTSRDARKIISKYKRGSDCFKSFRRGSYYVWKWRLFLLLLGAALALCISLALFVTLTMFFNYDLSNHFR